MQIVRMAKSDTIKGTDNIQPQLRKEGGGPEISGSNYGLAVDIGTTTVDMALYDLVSGGKIAGYQEKNRQTLLGADVMFSGEAGTVDPGAASGYGPKDL